MDCECCKKYKRTLAYVFENDKTEYDYYGKRARNRNGKLPDEGRWITPRELAEDALRQGGTSVWNVLKEIKQEEPTNATP
jgi:hypothetical protein